MGSPVRERKLAQIVPTMKTFDSCHAYPVLHQHRSCTTAVPTFRICLQRARPNIWCAAAREVSSGSNPDFILGGRTSASAESRHWSRRAVLLAQR